jgi:hypothetical protein
MPGSLNTWCPERTAQILCQVLNDKIAGGSLASLSRSAPRTSYLFGCLLRGPSDRGLFSYSARVAARGPSRSTAMANWTRGSSQRSNRAGSRPGWLAWLPGLSASHSSHSSLAVAGHSARLGSRISSSLTDSPWPATCGLRTAHVSDPEKKRLVMLPWEHGIYVMFLCS